jgi:manganese/zinc/iron transport system substrate-binding protein
MKLHPLQTRSEPLRPLALLFALLFALLLITSCTPTTTNEDGRLRVVTTIGMITDVATLIGGEGVRVEGLMGPGVDPHLYRATAGDLRRLREADLILFNGLYLEAALGEVLEGLEGQVRSVAITRAIPRSQLLAPEEFEGAFDPHVWSDVSLWRLVAAEIRELFIELDPEGAEGFRERHLALDRELEALDSWIRQEVQKISPERRVLVTAHDAFHYFGRAYGFEVRGLQGISTVTEAGAADVQALASFLVERSIPALFLESSVSPRTVESVRRAVLARGGSVVVGGTLYSDALGDPDSDAGSYMGMIRHNVATLVGALAP